MEKPPSDDHRQEVPPPSEESLRGLEDELRDVKARIADLPLGEVDMNEVRRKVVSRVWQQRFAASTFVLAGLILLYDALVARLWPDDALYFATFGGLMTLTGGLLFLKGHLERRQSWLPLSVLAGMLAVLLISGFIEGGWPDDRLVRLTSLVALGSLDLMLLFKSQTPAAEFGIDAETIRAGRRHALVRVLPLALAAALLGVLAAYLTSGR